jgi:hypothetical protein
VRRRLAGADGVALVAVLMATTLLIVLGTTLTLTTITETRIASTYRAGIETFYAAEAAIERAAVDLRAMPDWSVLAAGAGMSTFVDGQPGGPRSLADGTILDLTEATDEVRRGDQRQWRLFAYGPLARVLPAGRVHSRAYVVVWVADADSEAVALLAHGYGPQGVRRALEAVISRPNPSSSGGIRVRSWRQAP